MGRQGIMARRTCRHRQAGGKKARGKKEEGIVVVPGVGKGVGKARWETRLNRMVVAGRQGWAC